LQGQLHQAIPFYASCEVGNLKRTDSYCWAAFGPAGGAYRQVTHQSISIGPDGLRVFANTELKAAAERAKDVIGRAGDRLQAVLQELHSYSPFELILEERLQRQAMIYDYVPKLRLHSSMLAEASTRDIAWQALTQTMQRLPLPYLRVERLLAPAALLAREGEGPGPAIERVSEMLERNHALVEILNS
jgi:hypothetical protein